MVKKITKIIAITVLIFIFLFTIMTVIGAVLRDEKLLSPWGTAFFVIASGSMEPDIPTGSIVFVISVPPDKISVGDVITFFTEYKSEVVTHRVVNVSNDGEKCIITTRGAANNIDDLPFNYDRVIGRVSFTIPGSSFLIRLLGNVNYVAIAIISVGVILIIAGVVGSVRKSRRLKKEISEGVGTDSKEVGSGEQKVGLNVLDAGYDKAPITEVDFNKKATNFDEAFMMEVDSGKEEFDLFRTLSEVSFDNDGINLKEVLKEVDSYEIEIDFNKDE